MSLGKCFGQVTDPAGVLQPGERAGRPAWVEAAGRVVVFQARGPGRRPWHTFRRAETDDGGRFAARYRFRRTTESTTYRIRAVVPAQAGYPYLEGVSERRRVRVVGAR